MRRSWLLLACWTVSLVVVSQVVALGQTFPKPGPQHELLKEGRRDMGRRHQGDPKKARR